jgi:hypothetical protein
VRKEQKALALIIIKRRRATSASQGVTLKESIIIMWDEDKI